ncbi:U6 snRNA-associated Sm-like protein LSm6 [Trifolium pratense]|uniref:U6 snRNA-associated Sm-like protein LSm6 n=1 Tax=Trifolium pratense TaxID=57577 RepID=A0A2K3M2Q5_TRIPR|nr:U6 snRNA-associated Sm-like protein LSm6 [Trifolium pratense]
MHQEANAQVLRTDSPNYLGILACLDGYMNIAMEQTEEYVNGQLKNKYGDAFIRGNNVLYISTSKRTLAEGA